MPIPMPMPPAEKPMGALKPLDTGAAMEPIIGLEEGKPEMVELCTGAGRAALAIDRLFNDVMLFRRLLVRSLVCKIRNSASQSMSVEHCTTAKEGNEGKKWKG